jgi:predicted SpoU family rRNA methylase
MNVSGVKFSYFVVKNLHIIKSEVDNLQEIRKNILETNSEKDKKGKPILENVDSKTGIGNYKIIDEKKFEKDMEEFNKLLDEEVRLDFYKIKMSDIPETITSQQMMAIFNLIEEEKNGKV